MAEGEDEYKRRCRRQNNRVRSPGEVRGISIGPLGYPHTWVETISGGIDATTHWVAPFYADKIMILPDAGKMLPERALVG